MAESPEAYPGIDIEQQLRKMRQWLIQNPKRSGASTVIQPGERRHQTLRGNEGWHTDSLYIPFAARSYALSAEITPSKGELRDMRAAYDALDEVTKECIGWPVGALCLAGEIRLQDR